MDKKKNINEIVTEAFVNLLNKGEIPWERDDLGQVRCWSRDGKPLHLINQLLLPKGEYITFNQANAEGGKIIKGSKTTPVFYYKSIEVEQRNTKTNMIETVKVPRLRYFGFFNLSATTGLEQKYHTEEAEPITEAKASKMLDEIIKDYLEDSGMEVTKKGSDAVYSPTTDSITIPVKKQFKKKSDYYTVVLHGLVHSTGSEERLKRFHGAVPPSELENLIADITTNVLLTRYGFAPSKTADPNKWIKILTDDPKLIVTACSKAAKAIRVIEGNA